MYRHDRRMQYDSHLDDASRPPPLRPGVSWNMHDMLMRLVPNLIIQFHGSHHRPSLPQTPSPYRRCLSIVSLRAQTRALTHTRPPERFSFASLRGAFTSPFCSFPILRPYVSAIAELNPRRSSSAGCLTLTRGVARPTVASIIGSL